MSSHKRKADAAAASSQAAPATAAAAAAPAAKRPMFAAAAAATSASAPSASSDGIRVKQEDDAAASAAAAPPSADSAALKFEDDEEDEVAYTPQSHLSGLSRDAAGNILCPYLATINRRALDFDFEKLCSVTLANSNVYACLVCGKYFAGRGKSSPAYAHSLDPELEHHVFINLHSEEIFCLPDGYRVHDPSLSDIQYNLHPRFSAKDLAELERNTQFVHALDGTDYLPGLMGLNNLGEGQSQTSVAVKHSLTNRTDWINVLIQFLNFVPMFRNAFIVDKNEQQQQMQQKNGAKAAAAAAKKKLIKSETKGAASAAAAASSSAATPAAASSRAPPMATDLADKYGELLSKIWNPRSFKGHVSPHELLQTISTLSAKRFAIGKIHDVLQVLSWFLNELHREMGGTRKAGSSIVHRTFQGEIKITTTIVGTDDGASMGDAGESSASVTTVETKPFLYLSLALPAAPLFKDATDKAILPQIPLVELLRKFDGSSVEHSVDPVSKRDVRRTYRITRLPAYLIVHYQRFHENNWFWEKNPTLVNFPLQGLDMKPYTDQAAAPAATAAAEGGKLSEDSVRKMSVAELKQALRARGVRSDTAVEKSELVALLLAAPAAAASSASSAAASTSTRYNLLSNIVHDGLSGAAAKGREKELRGSYKCHTLHKATQTWYLTEDLHVHTSETMPQLVSLSESYMQLYERQPE